MGSVSVVVPFYNRAKFLNRLLDSVLNQNLRPIAVYIVDNGSSSKESASVIKIMSSNRFERLNIIYVSTLNRGNANFARNLGYELANTKYVAFLDSDDWWESSHLNKSIGLLEHSGKSAIYSGAKIHKKNGVNINKSVDVNDFDNPFDLILSQKGYLAQTSSYVVDKSDVCNAVVWDEKLKRHQDFDYFASLYYNTKGWCYCPIPQTNVDWLEGGTGNKEIEFSSLVTFYEKWKNNILEPTKISYLFDLLRLSYRNKAEIKYRVYYRNELLKIKKCNNIVCKLKVTSAYIYFHLMVVKVLDIFFMRKTAVKLKYFLVKRGVVS